MIRRQPLRRVCPRQFVRVRLATVASLRRGLLRLQGLHRPGLAHRAFVEELDAAGDFGEERVVLAPANIQARLYPRSALPHDDGSSGDYLSAECFETQPLRVRVAAVS